MFYYTFVNIFSNLHSFKKSDRIFKSNILTVKSLHIQLLAPTIEHTIQQKFIYIRHTNFVSHIWPREKSQVLVKFNQTIRVAYYF